MAAQHRRLLRILLAHELLRNECKPFEWRDQFANEALHILAQHAVQVKKILLIFVYFLYSIYYNFSLIIDMACPPCMDCL